jgi:uncharacterized protein (DUF305 family)
MKLTKVIVIATASAFMLTACANTESVDSITLEEDSTEQEVDVEPEEPLEGPEIVEEKPDRNSADGRFVSMMLPHHYQGLEMNILADRNTNNPEILDLSSQMTATHEGEVALLDDLFLSWDLPYFEGGEDMEMDSMNFSPDVNSAHIARPVHGEDGIDHENNDYLVDENPIYEEDYEPTGVRLMSGMLSDTEMIELFNARDDEFDKLWLEGMIMHHKGAIEMAKNHQDGGEYPTLLTLSEQMISQQESEIELMENILSGIEG